MNRLTLTDGMEILRVALGHIYQDGYVLSGEIQIHDPLNRRVDSELSAVVGDTLAVLTIKTVPRDGVATPAKPPSPLPLVVASVPDVRSFAVMAAASPQVRPSGNVCVACGSPNLRRAGTCETCSDCGSTSGCG